MQITQKVVGNLCDRNILNIQLIPFNKKEEQIKWTLKLRKMYLKIAVRIHGWSRKYDMSITNYELKIKN